MIDFTICIGSCTKILKMTIIFWKICAMISQKNLQMISFLCDLAEEKRYVNIQDLAFRFQVSHRTVRYDLDKIDYYLNHSGYEKLTRNRNFGVLLDISCEEIDKIRNDIQQTKVN